jgi:N-carbamoylputrescine amidase
MRLKIAGIQMSCSDNLEKNLKKAVEMTKVAAEKGAKVIALQEMFSLPWFPAEKLDENFGLADGSNEALDAMKRVAKDEKVVIVCPMFEKTDDGVYYNSAYVLDADGSVAGKYRKVHVPDIPLWHEKFYFSPGDLGFQVIQTRYVKIGVLICWDIFFPEAARALALKGAELLVVPTAAAYASAAKWEHMASSAAIANNVYVMRVNRVGGPERQRFYGKSFVVDPYGEIDLEPTGKNDAIMLTEIDTAEVEEARRIWNFMGDRRPDQYSDIITGGQDN